MAKKKNTTLTSSSSSDEEELNLKPSSLARISKKRKKKSTKQQDHEEENDALLLDEVHVQSCTKPTSLEAISSLLPKQRKQYTIQQKREKWSDEEHDRFMEAITQFGRDWKKVEEYIGTKTRKQIRSHAQKHFEKMRKNGEEFPAPRAKKKSSRPYPSK